jgi:hypothetical protein
MVSCQDVAIADVGMANSVIPAGRKQQRYASIAFHPIAFYLKVIKQNLPQ